MLEFSTVTKPVLVVWLYPISNDCGRFPGRHEVPPFAEFHSKLTFDWVVAAVLPAPNSHDSAVGKPTRMVVKNEKSVPQALRVSDSRRTCRLK